MRLPAPKMTRYTPRMIDELETKISTLSRIAPNARGIVYAAHQERCLG